MNKVNELNKISVVIPMYNSEKTIERALDSVISQTYQGKIEIIVVNDGSKDNSAEILENYNKERPNCTIQLINQQNGGVSKARNTGLKNATGEIIALLDSDDAWLEDKLEIQMKYLFNQDVNFVCALRNNDKITFPYKIVNNFSVITLKKLLFKVVGQTSTALFKKEVLQNPGFFDENQKYSEDANFWMRIAINNKMIILNEKLVTTENDYGQSGLSSNFKDMELGVQKNIREMYLLKQINFFEYIFFIFFSKFKYIIRTFKNYK